MISATRVETVETEEEEECCIISVEQGKRKCCKRKANDNMIDTGLSQVKFISQCIQCSVHPILFLWFLVTFGNKVTKILCNLCLHFTRQEGKKERKSTTKVTKIQKNKRRRYGMNET